MKLIFILIGLGIVYLLLESHPAPPMSHYLDDEINDDDSNGSESEFDSGGN